MEHLHKIGTQNGVKGLKIIYSDEVSLSFCIQLESSPEFVPKLSKETHLFSCEDKKYGAKCASLLSLVFSEHRCSWLLACSTENGWGNHQIGVKIYNAFTFLYSIQGDIKKLLWMCENWAKISMQTRRHKTRIWGEEIWVGARWFCEGWYVLFLIFFQFLQYKQDVKSRIVVFPIWG